MRKRDRMLAMIHAKPSKQTTRQLIILKDRKSYFQYIRLLKKNGITPIKTIKSLNMVCCHVDRNKVSQVAQNHSKIRRVEADVKARAHGFPKRKGARVSGSSTPWGVRRIGSPSVWPRSTGESIRIGVIDTGIGPNPDLKVAGGINTINPRNSFHDDNGHGTHVAGTAAARGINSGITGVAPRAKLYAVKALDQNGNGFVSDIIEGVEWCIDRRMDVINMSFGIIGNSPALRRSIRRANRHGIVVVASAGNNGSDATRIDEPARYPETIAVAASNRNNKIASFSSRGQEVDVAAPGVDILSLKVGKGTGTRSGTSMAAPHVSGSAALLLRLNPRLSPSQIRNLLASTALHLSGSSRRAQGSGLVQADRAADRVHANLHAAKPRTVKLRSPTLRANVRNRRPAKRKNRI
ncbi:hypothetical protein PAE9249_01123 [Paenibacillus sp. CECT 9249]|nr:hypothetical protein PAE9249_01123 [Paenibacillus sp. CECT 9249]